MLLILLCAFHFSFCEYEWVTQWKATVQLDSWLFGGKSGGYWDTGSDKAEAFARVYIASDRIFTTDNCGTNCDTNRWYYKTGRGEKVGSEVDVQTVTIELYDEDPGNDDFMGSGSFSLSSYKSYGDYFYVYLAFGRHEAQFTVGMWPSATQGCTSRSPSTTTTGCYSPADSYVGQTACAKPLNPSGSGTYQNGCVFSTNCGANLILNGANGLCNLKSCNSRISNTTHTYNCGENTCYRQMDADGLLNSSCNSACLIGNFYQPISNSGKCEFKACESRVVRTPAPYPCGTANCYQQISNGGSGSGTLNASCASTCDSNHFKESSGAKCVLLECFQRKPVSSLRYPCGTSDCYQQPEGSRCALTCPEHYNETDNGRCSSLPCEDRIPSDNTCRTPEGHSEDEPYCGFYTEGPFSGCVLCPDNHFVSFGGVCTLKPCPERVKNVTAELLCGSANCYVQPKISTIEYIENETDSGKCAKDCPEFFYSNSQDICTILPCLQRIPTNKTCRPDADFEEIEPTCGYYSENGTNGTDQGGCLYCPENHYMSVNGLCVLKDCTARTPNATAEFPCAEPSCLLSPDNTTNTTCVTECPEFFVNPATPGICTLLPCLERIPTDGHCRPGGGFAENEPTCGLHFENGTNQGKCEYCPENHYESANGVCVLKGCAKRTLNPETDFPCGELTCLLLPSGSGCDDYCPMNVSTADLRSGMCKYLMCEQRFKDDVFGCGSDCFLGKDGLKCVAEDPAKAKSKKASFPWWIIVVVVVVVVVSIAVVIIVLVIRMRTHKETPKDEPSQQQRGVEMEAANNGTSNDRSMPSAVGKPVVLLEEQEGSVTASGDDGDAGHWI